MARVGGGGGPRWVWPLIILLILIGLALLAWAFLAPQAPGTQSPSDTPTADPTQTKTVSISDIAGDPSSYFGMDVTVDGRISGTVGDQGIYLADPNGGGTMLFGVLYQKLSDTGLNNNDDGRFWGTVRQVTDDELNKLQDTVDKPTLDALSNEKVYLSVSNFEKASQ